MSGFKAIIESDSFSAIQWGFGKSSFPWRLADWVEEIQDILRQLGAPFSHVLREAYAITNALAKEGGLRSSISLDV